MSDTVDQPALVIHLLAQHFDQIGIDLFLAGPVAYVLLEMLELVDDGQIGSAVKRSLERSYSRRDRRIGIGSRRTGYADRERRVVAAAVLGMQHQRQIERARVELRIAALEHIEKILRYRKFLLRKADMQRAPLIAVTHDVVRIGDDRGKLRDQIDRLPHQVIARGIVRVIVEGVHAEHAAGQNIHDVLPLHVENVHLRLVMQRHEIVNQRTEGRQLLPVGQVARQKKKDGLLETEPFLGLNTPYQVFDADTPVDQLARNRLHLTFGLPFDLRQPDQHAGMVLVAQPPLDVVFHEKIRLDMARRLDRLRQLVNDVLSLHLSSYFNFATAQYTKLCDFLQNVINCLSLPGRTRPCRAAFPSP